MIGQWQCLVVDCPDPDELAGFYEQLLGMSRIEDEPGWVTLRATSPVPDLAFQRSSNFKPPQWPTGAVPQQLHIDVLVDDLDVAQERVLGLGASLLEGSDKPIGYRVYADPVGHPFCLVTRHGLAEEQSEASH